MSLIHLALVVESNRVSRREIKEVAAAVQRQLSRDFIPIWGREATIDPFVALEDVEVRMVALEGDELLEGAQVAGRILDP